MSKKHFIAIAAAISGIRTAKDRKAAADAIAAVCATANPRFDRSRFMAACNAN